MNRIYKKTKKYILSDITNDVEENIRNHYMYDSVPRKMPFIMSDGKVIYRKVVRSGMCFYENCYNWCKENKVIALDYDVCSCLNIWEHDQLFDIVMPASIRINLIKAFRKIGLKIDYFGYKKTNDKGIIILMHHEDVCCSYWFKNNKRIRMLLNKLYKQGYHIEIYTNTLIEE